MEIIDKSNMNSALFYKYLTANGFDPNNCENILEIGASAQSSVSQFLKYYNQFLLSLKVRETDLFKAGIKGAVGHLKKGDIFIPLVPISDEHIESYFCKSFNKDKYPQICDRDKYPTIKQFDVVMSDGYSLDSIELQDLEQEIYIGSCRDIEPISEGRPMITPHYVNFEVLYDIMNRKYNDNFVFLHDVASSINKEYCLIKKKKG